MAKSLAARETKWERFDGADPNRRMALEETPWLRESRGGGTKGDDNEALLRVLDPAVARAVRADALAKLAQGAAPVRRLPLVPGRTAVALHDALPDGRLRARRRVRRRDPGRDGPPRLAVPGGRDRRRLVAPGEGERLLLGAADFRQLRRLLLSRSDDHGRRPAGRAAARDPRLLLRALEGARAAVEAPARAHAEPHGPAAGRAPRARRGHGLGEERPRSRHLLGARGSRLALVQRHDRDPRLGAAGALRDRPRRSAARRARAVALPPEEARTLEVDPRHLRGPLLAGALPRAGETARGARGAGRDGGWKDGPLRLRARPLHRQTQPDRAPRNARSFRPATRRPSSSRRRRASPSPRRPGSSRPSGCRPRRAATSSRSSGAGSGG